MACVKKFFNAIADYGVIVKAQAILFLCFSYLRFVYDICFDVEKLMVYGFKEIAALQLLALRESVYRGIGNA